MQQMAALEFNHIPMKRRRKDSDDIDSFRGVSETGLLKKNRRADSIDKSIDRQISKMNKKMVMYSHKRGKARDSMTQQSQSSLSALKEPQSIASSQYDMVWQSIGRIRNSPKHHKRHVQKMRLASLQHNASIKSRDLSNLEMPEYDSHREALPEPKRNSVLL